MGRAAGLAAVVALSVLSSLGANGGTTGLFFGDRLFIDVTGLQAAAAPAR